MLKHWYYYVIAGILSVAGSYYYLKNRIPEFEVASTVLIGEGETDPGEELLQGFAIRPGLQNLDNQMLIISSYNIIRRTVEELPFEVDVYRKGLFSQISYFPMSPLIIEAGPDGFPYGIEFQFEYTYGDYFHLSSIGSYDVYIDSTFLFGESIQLPQGSFSIMPQSELEAVIKSKERIYFTFYSTDELTNLFLYRLMVQPVTSDGGIVRLSLQGTNRVKDILFLNRLTEVFIADNLDKKNTEAKRIIEFIDAQLVDVSDSLALTESQLQDFRSRNRIMDVSAQAGQIVEQALQLENEKARLTLEHNYFDYLDDYLDSEDNDAILVVPSTMSISDPLLESLIQELVGLQTEYFSSGVGERNPLQGQLETRLRKTKRNIKETLHGIRLANQMAIDENSRQISSLNREAARLPVKEQQLLGFERKFNLNNVLYTYLLQERAQAQIQRASNKPDHELVDTARVIAQVAPNMITVLMLAITLILAIPTIILFLRDIFRNTLNSEADIKQITQLPIIAQFPNSRLKYNTVVLTEPDSIIAETFRNLRTRMDFFTKDVICPTILVTSSMPGEGKTFTAINLASAYSLAGMKTLILGFDLRRPTISQSFDIENETGLTSYLIGKATLDEIIFDTTCQNLNFIPSGPIPPNPGELSGSSKATEMISKLREKFDIIIIDSPPIGIVSDIYQIALLADVKLLMIRHNHTKRRILHATLSELQLNGIKGVSLIVNDVRSGGRNGYNYSYKYRYRYKSVASLK